MSKRSALKRGERCDSDWCEVRHSGIHGRGLFAKQRIPENTAVIQYIEEKIDKEESTTRGWAQIDLAKLTGDAAVYIFALDDDYDLDGKTPKNAARLINHSCSPNCESYIDEGEIWIASLREIAEGEELFFNYGFDLDYFEDHPCLCGSTNCVGFIAGEEFWTDLKKRLAKPARKKKQKG